MIRVIHTTARDAPDVLIERDRVFDRDRPLDDWDGCDEGDAGECYPSIGERDD